jgi:hypothetical protein
MMSAVEQFPSRIQNHFRRRSVENAEPLEVFILAYDDEPVAAGMLPDSTIGPACQA